MDETYFLSCSHKLLGELNTMIGRTLWALSRQVPFVPTFLLSLPGHHEAFRHPETKQWLAAGRSSIPVPHELCTHRKSLLRATAHSCYSNLNPAFPHNHHQCSSRFLMAGNMEVAHRHIWVQILAVTHQLCDSSSSGNFSKLWISSVQVNNMALQVCCED